MTESPSHVLYKLKNSGSTFKSIIKVVTAMLQDFSSSSRTLPSLSSSFSSSRGLPPLGGSLSASQDNPFHRSTLPPLSREGITLELTNQKIFTLETC